MDHEGWGVVNFPLLKNIEWVGNIRDHQFTLINKLLFLFCSIYTKLVFSEGLFKAIVSISLISVFTTGVILSVPGLGGQSINIDLARLVITIMIFVFIVRLPFILMTISTGLVGVFPVIFLYPVVNILSTLFRFGLEFSKMKPVVLIGIFVLSYTCVVYILNKLDLFDSTLKWFLRLIFVSSLIGIGFFILSLITGNGNIGVSLGHVGFLPSIRSLTFEPNLFAVITSLGIVYHLSEWFCTGKVKNPLILAILVISVLLSFTRSIYLALVVVTFIGVWSSGRKKVVSALFKSAGIIIIIFSILVWLETPIVYDTFLILSERLLNLFNFTEGSGWSRYIAYVIGISGFLSSPIFGQGTMSANTTVFNPFTNEYYDAVSEPGWLTGAWIQSLHDTGIVGFSITIGMFITIIINNWYLLKKETDSFKRTILLFFLLSSVLIFISSQISSSLWILFPWFFWALNSAFIGKHYKTL